MQTIRLVTWIAAPVERCYRLSLSVDLHVASAKSSGEVAVGGVTTGILGEGETVTFQGRHFGMKFRHTSKLVVSRPHTYFRDVMVEGMFRHFEHDHHFAAMDDGTRVRDEVRFSAPMGPLGKLAEAALLRRHLTALLTNRNKVIKQVAESEEWHQYLDGRSEVVKAIPLGGQPPVRSRWDRSALLRG
jgi:ligand-binding SRPBCC domain-containing protein